MEIPVYMFTGFLDAGKSTFLQSTLEDKRFNNGERTLVLLCEEGECELNPTRFSGRNITIQRVESVDQLTTANLTAWQKGCRAQRVMVEYNGMWAMDDLFRNIPKNWVIYQEMMFADANTFEIYNANMRERVVDKLQGAQLVVFNRSQKEADKMPLHKIVRGVSRQADIAYEYENDEVEYDTIEDPLPFDINAPVIEVKDEDYALWYRDVTEEPAKYHGKTVRFKGQVAMLRRDKNNMFAPGRFVMTCCVDDIQFCGIPCDFVGAAMLEPRSWVDVIASIRAERHYLYNGELGPVMTAISVKPTEAAQQDVATF